MSKANQAFKQADEAVSPVIGVILMVAITVVLAAVVFVLVSNLSDSGDQAPQMSFTKDPDSDGTGGTLTLISVSEGGLLWSGFTLGGTATGCTIDDSTGSVTAGDTITCTGDGTINVVHTATNSLAYKGEF